MTISDYDGRWKFGYLLFLVIFNLLKNFYTGTLSWWDDDDVAFSMIFVDQFR